MNLGIEGKKAIICASSRGLGKAIAEQLAQEGVENVINGTNKENLTKTHEEFIKKKYKVSSVLGPMEEDATRKKLLAACPNPDILINNSGGPAPGNFFDWTEDDFLNAIKSNFTQSALLMQAVIPGMQKNNFGRIINMTSAMVKNPHLMMGLSTSARSGLHGLSKALSKEFAKDNITINCILPERIATDRQIGIINYQAKLANITYEEALKIVEDDLPAKRMGKVEEISGICTFLCSQQAAFITGQSISVDGGSSEYLL